MENTIADTIYDKQLDFLCVVLFLNDAATELDSVGGVLGDTPERLLRTALYNGSLVRTRLRPAAYSRRPVTKQRSTNTQTNPTENISYFTDCLNVR